MAYTTGVYQQTIQAAITANSFSELRFMPTWALLASFRFLLVSIPLVHTWNIPVSSSSIHRGIIQLFDQHCAHLANSPGCLSNTFAAGGALLARRA